MNGGLRRGEVGGSLVVSPSTYDVHQWSLPFPSLFVVTWPDLGCLTCPAIDTSNGA
jgi:hypothetical protein